MASANEEASSVPRRRLSCTTCFNALCGDGKGALDEGSPSSSTLPPVHQMQQYYRVGVLDNCAGKWSDLVDCLALKTKRASDVQEILETREKAKHHIWTFRTPEEASSHWKELFGHLDEPE